MGQAKNRAAEINELKKTPKDPLLNKPEMALMNLVYTMVKRYGWEDGYECPENCANVVETSIEAFKRENPGFVKAEVLQSLLVFRENYENAIAPKFGINLNKLRSMDSDSEIAKITDSQVAYMLGVMDATIGALAVKRVSVSGLYEHYTA